MMHLSLSQLSPRTVSCSGDSKGVGKNQCSHPGAVWKGALGDRGVKGGHLEISEASFETWHVSPCGAKE